VWQDGRYVRTHLPQETRSHGMRVGVRAEDHCLGLRSKKLGLDLGDECVMLVVGGNCWAFGVRRSAFGMG
jgi:hypothetical protein